MKIVNRGLEDTIKLEIIKIADIILDRTLTFKSKLTIAERISIEKVKTILYSSLELESAGDITLNFSQKLYANTCNYYFSYNITVNKNEIFIINSFGESWMDGTNYSNRDVIYSNKVLSEYIWKDLKQNTDALQFVEYIKNSFKYIISIIMAQPINGAEIKENTITINSSMKSLRFLDCI